MLEEAIKHKLKESTDYSNKDVLIKLKNSGIIIGEDATVYDDYCTINTGITGQNSKKVMFSDIKQVQIVNKAIIAKNGMHKCGYCNEEMPAEWYAQCPYCKKHASIY